MKCPKCKITELRATRIESDLPAAGCATCHGALVSLLYYRDWSERHQNDPTDVATAPTTAAEVRDTSTALNCPKCTRLMTKYKISGCAANRLDLCPGCDEAWLDSGEWELLSALELSRKMPLVFTEQWQRTIRRQVAEEARRGILRKKIGDAAVDRVEEFKMWVDENPRKRDILVYLYAEYV